MCWGSEPTHSNQRSRPEGSAGSVSESLTRSWPSSACHVATAFAEVSVGRCCEVGAAERWMTGFGGGVEGVWVSVGVGVGEGGVCVGVGVGVGMGVNVEEGVGVGVGGVNVADGGVSVEVYVGVGAVGVRVLLGVGTVVVGADVCVGPGVGVGVGVGCIRVAGVDVSTVGGATDAESYGSSSVDCCEGLPSTPVGEIDSAGRSAVPLGMVTACDSPATGDASAGGAVGAELVAIGVGVAGTTECDDSTAGTSTPTAEPSVVTVSEDARRRVDGAASTTKAAATTRTRFRVACDLLCFGISSPRFQTRRPGGCRLLQGRQPPGHQASQ